MSHYGYDMDHDGKITRKDHAMFHEMMDEDQRQYSGHTPSYTNHSWTREEWKVFLVRWLIMMLFFAPVGALLKGSIPSNFFTVLLSVVCTPIGVKLLFDIFDMM